MIRLLAIDQGTTSSRAIVFNEKGGIISIAQQEFEQIFPKNGWVEHNPEEIWSSVLKTCREAARKAGYKINRIGITNQRETIILWNRKTGKPVYNAIVWQDRRTADLCAQLKKKGYEKVIKSKTGLLLDPYFSATKIAWILDNVKGVRKAAEKGDIAFGTIDSFLLWRLTDGKVHATDATNASRTMLFDIQKNKWDSKLLKIFNIPENILPEVRDCVADFGKTTKEILGQEITIGAMIGDQQSATVGQACFSPGMVKSTYGTGCFVMVNTGTKIIKSKNRLLSTIAYRIKGRTTYGLEGSVFISGAVVKWLRDKMHLINNSSETEKIAREQKENNGVYLVPAFTGLGAPYWQPEARGAILGLTRDTGPEEIIRAALESVCYQTYDLLMAMAKDGVKFKKLRVDGGMVNNNWLMQFLSDVLQISIERPTIHETTAFGAAALAGVQAGIFKSLKDIDKCWSKESSYSSKMTIKDRDLLIKYWKKAIKSVLCFSEK